MISWMKCHWVFCRTLFCLWTEVRFETSQATGGLDFLALLYSSAAFYNWMLSLLTNSGGCVWLWALWIDCEDQWHTLRNLKFLFRCVFIWNTNSTSYMLTLMHWKLSFYSIRHLIQLWVTGWRKLCTWQKVAQRSMEFHYLWQVKLPSNSTLNSMS